MSEWQQYPDTTIRETYPSLPRTMGDPNKVAEDRVVASVVSQHARSVQQEAEFRARQYARRLQTRGLAAMRSPATPTAPEPEMLALPDDPVVDAYRAAGMF